MFKVFITFYFFLACLTCHAMEQTVSIVDAVDFPTIDALRALIYKGKVTDLKNQLSKGISANACSELGYSILQTACECSQLDIVTMLLKHGANPKSRPQYYNSNFTIHSAISTNAQSPTIVELLLAYGADAIAQGHNKFTPLHVAAELGAVSVCNVLLIKAQYGVEHTLLISELMEEKCALIAQKRLNAVRKALTVSDKYNRTPLKLARSKLDFLSKKKEQEPDDIKLMQRYATLIPLLDPQVCEQFILKPVLDDVRKILQNHQKNRK